MNGEPELVDSVELAGRKIVKGDRLLIKITRTFIEVEFIGFDPRNRLWVFRDIVTGEDIAVPYSGIRAYVFKKKKG